MDGGQTPSAISEPEPPATHQESVTYLVAEGAKSPKAIRSAARLPLARIRAIVAEDRAARKGIGFSMRRCAAEADAPELGALIATATTAAPRPKPSDAAIWGHPNLSGTLKQTWLARYRRAETDDARWAVLDRLAKEHPDATPNAAD